MAGCGNPAVRGRNRGSCFRVNKRKLNSLKKIVDDYIRKWRTRSLCEIKYFKDIRNLSEVIKRAALSTFRCGDKERRHAHQRRIPGNVLAEAARILTGASSRLSKCPSFAILHDVIKEEIRPIRGIGPLTRYDIATRIGARLDKEPEMVYLHAGTAKGARALGLRLRGRKTLHMRELPREFWVLKPYEIEDCLCLYEEDLSALRSCS